MREWNEQLLIDYNEKIEKIAQGFGLDYYPQEFEICDFDDMISYMVYVGMPSHYPHWSYGKSHEIQKMQHKLGMSGLPYEMVINSNPSLAYLMNDNTLLLQILTIAHVYGHNDFFKNNRLFVQGTDADRTVEMFKTHADKIRNYISNPNIGPEKVERILTAAHALQYQIPKNIGVKELSYEEQKEQKIQSLIQKQNDSNPLLTSKKEKRKLEYNDLVNEYWIDEINNQLVVEPEEDLLKFIATYGKLQEWERDIVNIVREEMQYFAPQMETKIMNEGWASYWHYNILKELELPSSLHLEFLQRHNSVIRPHLGQINPYFVGFKVFEWIDNNLGREEMFFARENHRDESFLRHYLNQELVHDLNLFEFEKKKEEGYRTTTTYYEITEVANDEGWMKIRDRLASSVGLNKIPNITIDEYRLDTLYLSHIDELSLEKNYAQKTVNYIAELWGGQVALGAKVNKKNEIIISEKNK